MSVCLDFRSLFDNFAGSIVHLAARDTSFAAISCAPLAKIEFVQEADGLEFPVAVLVWQRLQLRFPRHVGRSHGPGTPDRPVVEFGLRRTTILLSTIFRHEGAMKYLCAIFNDEKKLNAMPKGFEARDLNDAIQVTSKIPPAHIGRIEVRPIMELISSSRE
jgi:Bacterial protein of unknown function (DUF899)